MSTRVAAVQLAFQYFSTPQEFADAVRAPLEHAARQGAQLVLLPHTLSFALFGIFDYDARADEALDALAQRRNRTTREWLQEHAGYVFELYVHVFQSLAARTETWLVPGTALEPGAAEFFLTACVFNPAGEIVGRQHQMHRTASEIAWSVKQGDTLRVFETEIGDCGLVLGEDVRYPETARALALNGANVLLHPAAYGTLAAAFPHAAPFPSPDEQFLQDLWRDVQGNQTFGVQANLVGKNYRGHSAIYAPVELTDDKRGILAQTVDATPQILFADLDFEKLEVVRRTYPILDLLNPALDIQVTDSKEE